MRLAFLLLTLLFATSHAVLAKEVMVKEHTRKDGTVVKAHVRQVKVKTPSDLQEVKGYTRKDGTVVKGYTRKKTVKKK